MFEPQHNAANGATKDRKGQRVLLRRPREINKLNMQTGHRLADRRSRGPRRKDPRLTSHNFSPKGACPSYGSQAKMGKRGRGTAAGTQHHLQVNKINLGSRRTNKLPTGNNTIAHTQDISIRGTETHPHILYLIGHGPGHRPIIILTIASNGTEGSLSRSLFPFGSRDQKPASN